MVSPYGQLSVVEGLRRDFAEIMRLPNAIFVEFAVFDCERDIVNVSDVFSCAVVPNLLTSYSATVDTALSASRSLTSPSSSVPLPVLTRTGSICPPTRKIVSLSGWASLPLTLPKRNCVSSSRKLATSFGYSSFSAFTCSMDRLRLWSSHVRTWPRSRFTCL
jgi:hypothetical protein